MGFEIPVLHFSGMESFATLISPDAYYVVIAEYPDNLTRLSLTYKNPACTTVMPPCRTFEARITPYSVVTMADAAIRASIWEPHVLTALRALNVPLTAPDTRSHSAMRAVAPHPTSAPVTPS